MELFIIMIAWFLGIIWGLYCRISIALFLIFLILFYMFSRKNNYLKIIIKKKYIIIFIICFLISYFQITYIEKSFNQKYKDVKEEIEVVGTIISNPSDKDYKITYTLNVESINKDLSYKNTKLLLSVKKEEQQTIYEYGNKIVLKGEFQEAEVKRNYGGFDYKEYLKTKGIYGLVKTNHKNIKIVKENNSNFILKFANDISKSIENRANKLFDKNKASLITGLLIGNIQNLDEDIKEAFRDSNLTHMLAVSGSHMSYIITLISFVISIGKIGKVKSKIITIIILVFFMLITGSSMSVVRACIMSVYMILASLFHKRVNIISSISISFFILMIINPYCILDIGLQLSYGGTIGIVFIYNNFKNIFIKNRKNKNQNKNENEKTLKENIKVKLIDMIFLTISANIIIIPITMYHFNNISLTFVISNVLTSLIIGLLMLVSFVTIMISYIIYPLAQFLSIFLNILLELFIQIATITSKLPFSKILVPTIKIEFIVLYYFFIAIIIFINKIKAKKKKRKIEKKILLSLSKIRTKKIIVILLIITTMTIIFNKNSKYLEIYFIDVSQGDSTLIVTPNNKKILIDGGGSETYDVGGQVLIPYLLDRNVISLDYVLISHVDTDHIGGIFSVLENIKVKEVIICSQAGDSENYQKLKEIVNKKKIKVRVVKKGNLISIDKDVNLKILWPTDEFINENVLNNNSIVAKLEYKTFSMLLTGDIEEIAERKILEEYENTNILRSTVLKIAHHGSKSSSIQSFLNEVKPKIALIGVGKNNTFGHPNDGVLERLKNIRSKSV